MNSNSDSVQPPSDPAKLSPEMSAEIDAAMEVFDRQDQERQAAAAAKLLERPAANQATRAAGTRGPRIVTAGRIHRTGNVVSVGPTDIFLEFGPKELGVIPRLQFPDEATLPKVGEPLEVVIDKHEAAENLFICSRPGSVQKAAWEALEPGQVVEARVTGVSKGGLECELADHSAFMPASQVSIERVPDLSVFVGEKLKCKVVRVERVGRGNIVLSRRDVLDEDRRANADKLRSTLAEGAVVEGTVRKVMPFGAFVDIGGLDGLVHISDMTFDRVGFGEKAVEKYVKEGQKVQVRILKLDIDNDRISLGMKQVQGDPFASATEKIQESAEVTGKITKIVEFGAFVDLGAGVEGLVHISELDHKRVAKVDDVVKVDEIVRVKVLKIDPQNRRISLSIKALKPLPEVAIGGGGAGVRAKDRKPQGRSEEEIKKETPALRRLRERSRQMNYKGGLS